MKITTSAQRLCYYFIFDIWVLDQYLDTVLWIFDTVEKVLLDNMELDGITGALFRFFWLVRVPMLQVRLYYAAAGLSLLLSFASVSSAEFIPWMVIPILILPIVAYVIASLFSPHSKQIDNAVSAICCSLLGGN